MTLLKSTTLAVWMMALSGLAQAATVTVTIEDAGVMEADLSVLDGVTVETFDGLGTGQFTKYDSALGTYSAGRVKPTDRYGGAEGSQYLFSQTSPGSTLSLKTPATYFGLWWSAGSQGNRVDLIRDGISFFSFNTDDVLDYLAGHATQDYFGNPTDAFSGQVGHEPFVYINLFSDMVFDTVVLSGRNFESDNHTVAERFKQPTGTQIAPVPLPASLPLLAGAFGAMAFLTRRRRKA